MRIPSGVVDQFLYFVAVDSSDLKTRETGLSSFTVYRSRDGAAAAAYTTPTVNETDSTNMPGVYELLLDEDMDIASGNDSEEVCLHITQASMAAVTRVFELYRPKLTAGNTLDVTATGAGGIDWGNVENPTTALDLSGTDIQLVDTTTTNTDMRGTDSAALATALATAQTDLDTITGTDGVTLATAQGLYAPSKAGDVMALTTGAIDGIWDEDIVAAHGTADTSGLILSELTKRTVTFTTAVADGSIVGQVADDGTAVFDRTTDSLQALADGGGGGPTAASIADAVWDEDIVAAHATADTSGLIVSQLTKRSVTFNTDVADDSILGQVADDGTATYDRTTDSLQAIADSGGGGPTAEQIADAVWDETTVGHTTASTFGEQCKTDIDSILIDTTEIGTAGASLTDLGGMSTGMKGEVNAECDTALTDYDAVVPADLPTNFGDLAITVTTGKVTVGTNDDKTGYSISGTKTTLDALNDVSTAEVNIEVDSALSDIDLDHFIQITAGVEEPTIGSYLDQVLHKDGSQTYSQTTDSLEAVRDRGDSAWITATGFSTHDAAAVWAVGTRDITGGTIDTNNDKTGYTLTSAEQDAIVDKVWDEALSGHSTGGSAGKIVSDTGVATLAVEAHVDDVSPTATDFDTNLVTAVDEYYEHQIIVFIDGDLAGQSRIIEGYTGSSKNIVIANSGFTSAPTNGDSFIILASHAHPISEVVNGVWDEDISAPNHNISDSAARIIRTMHEFQDYDGGSIWIDTVNGTAGTTDFENGTANNPVNTLADAVTLSISLGIHKFVLSPGSSITLISSFDNFVFNGLGWTIALGGQSISDTHINGATVSGICTGAAKPTFDNCILNAVTLPSSTLKDCRFANTITLADAGDYFFEQCFSGIAGTGTPSIDFGAAVVNTNLNIRHYSGGIEIQNMNGAGTDTMSLEGFGQLIINANCSGGTISVRGNFTVTDNAGGAVTLSDDARIDIGQINSEVVDALNVDTYAEPGQGAPAATASIAVKINYLYKQWRNKSDSDSSGINLYDDAGTTVDQKRTHSDDSTTYTRNEVITGP